MALVTLYYSMMVWILAIWLALAWKILTRIHLGLDTGFLYWCFHWIKNIDLYPPRSGRAELHWNFSSIPKDGSDIHRFSNRKWVSTMCTVGNLWISEASLSKLEKFQCSLVLLNIKYNYAVSFWSQLYWVLIYDSKYIFS